MFGFIKRLGRPFGMLGEKIAEVFNIGRKTNVVKDLRNVEAFVDLAPKGLRTRQIQSSAIQGLHGGYYEDRSSMLKNIIYPAN